VEEKLKALYFKDIDQLQPDFNRDPEYQKYYAQAEELWDGADMPEPVFHLLEISNFMSFASGFRLGMELAGWVREG